MTGVRIPSSAPYLKFSNQFITMTEKYGVQILGDFNQCAKAIDIINKYHSVNFLPPPLESSIILEPRTAEEVKKKLKERGIDFNPVTYTP